MKPSWRLRESNVDEGETLKGMDCRAFIAMRCDAIQVELDSRRVCGTEGGKDVGDYVKI